MGFYLLAGEPNDKRYEGDTGYFLLGSLKLLVQSKNHIESSI